MHYPLSEIIVFGYLDPGTGFVYSSVIVTVLKLFGAIFMSGLFYFRDVVRRHFWISLVIFLGIVMIISLAVSMKKSSKSPVRKSIGQRKVYILGFDGMDPSIVREGFARNLLPNLKSLAYTGTMRTLETVTPPQSPVVWASFITGMNPSRHHIYDFIRRDPTSYLLDLSFAKQQKRFIQPPTMWERISDAGVPVDVLFLPDTYPPTKLNGVLLSGMGVPDITGTEGKYVYYSSKDGGSIDRMQGSYIPVSASDSISTYLPGPAYRFFSDTKTATVPLTISRRKNSVMLEIQGKHYPVREGTFSVWIPVSFRIDLFTAVRGIVKFYLVSAGTDFSMYASPINFDPESPVLPISYPPSAAKQIAEHLGPYATLGLPLDTWALENGIIDERAFLKQVDMVLSERENIVYDRLKEFRSGVFIAYFGITDTVSHMFWKDRTNPDSPYSDTVMKYYGKMDDIVGKTMKTMSQDDVLIVLSDHGFGPFDYEMNLNSWLRDNGYLTMKNGATTGKELFADIDWTKTQAYAAGYNGIFLNIAGRETHGIVPADRSETLIREISDRLLAYKNPKNNTQAIKHLYTRSELGIEGHDPVAPDIFVGYFRGIRTSWSSAVGGVSAQTVSERTGKWSGDHLFDASEVPGIFIINRKIARDNTPINITDILPSVLGVFGIPATKELDGTSFGIR